MRCLQIISLLSCATSLTNALSASQWRSQSIYQVVTDRFARTDLSTIAPCDPYELGGVYCGGSWQGLIRKLDYIQDLGFTAIWISPIVHNIEGNTTDGSAYHGFWADDIYSLNEHFGTPADLKALSQALHNRNMLLMVDIVINHYAWNGPVDSIDFSAFTPFNSSSYFHPYSRIDYNNATSILQGWEGDRDVVPLVDLVTESVQVQSIFNSWIKKLVNQYNIDGIRLDSYQQTGIAPASSFQNASGVYVMGEVFDGSVSKVCGYQTGGVNVLNYPAYYWITRAFQSSSGSMADLANGLLTIEATCDPTLQGTFIENHDNARFPSLTNDITRAMNAIAFTILQDGIPIIYQGQEQHLSGSGTPGNREALWLSGYNTSTPLYGFIKSINMFRRQVISKNHAFVTNNIQPVYWDSRTLVTSKGRSSSQVIGVYTNVGHNAPAYTVNLAKNVTMFNKNEQVIDVISCELFTTDRNGNLAMQIVGGMPRVLYTYKPIAGSRICETIVSSPTATTATSALPSATCSLASIHFAELVNTTYGENVVVTGNIPALGSWSPAAGVALNANAYTVASPLWQGDVGDIDPGEVFQYKFVVVGTDGSYDWQPGNNLQATAPVGCMPTTTISNAWPTAT